jgi:hypothetical protein
MSALTFATNAAITYPSASWNDITGYVPSGEEWKVTSVCIYTSNTPFASQIGFNFRLTDSGSNVAYTQVILLGASQGSISSNLAFFIPTGYKLQVLSGTASTNTYNISVTGVKRVTT